MDYLEKHAPEVFRPGDIVDLNGRVLGHHQGIPRYTIGQRRGLGIASRHPLYVVALDGKKNQVIVGSNEDLFRQKLLADNLDFTDGQAPEKLSAVKPRSGMGSVYIRQKCIFSGMDVPGLSLMNHREPLLPDSL